MLALQFYQVCHVADFDAAELHKAIRFHDASYVGRASRLHLANYQRLGHAARGRGRVGRGICAAAQHPCEAQTQAT